MIKKTIIWPINPNDSNEKLDNFISSFLTDLSRQFDLSIKPVSVLSSNFYSTSEYFEPIDMKIFINGLRDDCKNYLKKFDINFEELVILENFYGSKRGEVAVFSDFVDESNADFAVMSSHGRKGWSRAFLGSFTESFLIKSSVPVFVVGPEYEKQGSVQNAIMPVELGESSESFLKTFLDHSALSFVKKIKLFHKVSMVDLENITWSAAGYGLDGVNSYDVRGRAKEQTEKKLNEFVSSPGASGRLTYEVSESLDSLSIAISQCAEKDDVGLIIMRSESGFWATNVLGSVTRQVIRDSKVPVVVYPHSCTKIN